MTEQQANRAVVKRYVIKQTSDGLWAVLDRCTYKIPIRDGVQHTITTLGVFIYRGDAIRFRDVKRSETAVWYQSTQYEAISRVLSEHVKTLSLSHRS